MVGPGAQEMASRMELRGLAMHFRGIAAVGTETGKRLAAGDASSRSSAESPRHFPPGPTPESLAHLQEPPNNPAQRGQAGSLLAALLKLRRKLFQPADVAS